MSLRKIGKIARELALCERRIREYERAGLIRPRRELKTGDRLFSKHDVEQLRLIKKFIHDQGFTINALQQLIRYAPCWELTGCEMKVSCEVPSNPRVPCYKQRAAGARTDCAVECERCLIHHSKDLPRPRVVVTSQCGFDPTTTITPVSGPDAGASGRQDAVTHNPQST